MTDRSSETLALFRAAHQRAEEEQAARASRHAQADQARQRRQFELRLARLFGLQSNIYPWQVREYLEQRGVIVHRLGLATAGLLTFEERPGDALDRLVVTYACPTCRQRTTWRAGDAAEVGARLVEHERACGREVT